MIAGRQDAGGEVRGLAQTHRDPAGGGQTR